MAERVIDALEFVDVYIEHGELYAGLQILQRLLQLLAEQHAVRQVRQRIVMCEMGDLVLGALAGRDVLDGRYPAARWQRLVDDLDSAAAGRFRDLPRRLAESDIADDCAAERLDVAVERSGLLAVR